VGIVAWIIVGLLAGWLATQILGGRGGLLYNLAVGLVGPSLVASFLKSFDWKSCRISEGI
jgi:uncharacterized membrane protein YeaQ/YmgE (transglycosylase-associated protein family)